MTSVTVGWIAAIVLVAAAGWAGVEIGRRLERRLHSQTVGPLTVWHPVLCRLSGRPIEQCPPEHRHFAPPPTAGFSFRPAAPVAPPEQASQVARTPHRPATVPEPKKPAQPRRKHPGAHREEHNSPTQANPVIKPAEEAAS